MKCGPFSMFWYINPRSKVLTIYEYWKNDIAQFVPNLTIEFNVKNFDFGLHGFNANIWVK